ncbi:Uma2 family endonuclease [Streptomyces carpaticus]|uniref:Uma2 family endonuclease n=1 Tax=Streptomyces TaxID=1883 RepID=UPI0003118896|nr:Uma2 family endonuclease [Streptomyces sp. AA0539]UWM50259.1 Uma2 family endonuclease [Streptomyces carpaticus]
MSVQPEGYRAPHAYEASDPETALKYAIQHIRGDRTEIIEGVIEPVSPSWDHENAADLIRDQLVPALRRLNCAAGAGNLDLPGSSNWYVPDLAVVPRDVAAGAGALLPDQTLLIVEVTSDSSADTDRVVKRRRYAEFRAPLYLLVDRQERSCSLFSHPGELGYSRVDGPHPFGTPIELPEPFGIAIDTKDLG